MKEVFERRFGESLKRCVQKSNKAAPTLFRRAGKVEAYDFLKHKVYEPAAFWQMDLTIGELDCSRSRLHFLFSSASHILVTFNGE